MLDESAAIVLLDYYRRYERTMCDIPKSGGEKRFIEDKSIDIEVQVEVRILTSTQGDVENQLLRLEELVHITAR